MSSRRQRSITLGGRYRQVSLYCEPFFVHFDLQVETFIGRTLPFQTLKVKITVKNVLASSPNCHDDDSVVRMWVLTQPGTTPMGDEACKPFCVGLQLCDVINVNTLENEECYTLECRCHGYVSFRDLALWIPMRAALDTNLPMGICDIKLQIHY